MKKRVFLVSLASTILAGCMTPTMQTAPKQEAGKGAVVLYSSTLQPTSFFNYSVNNERAGTIDGGKVHLVYFKPGTYNFSVDVPYVRQPLTKTLNIKSGENYYLNVYSTTDKSKTTQQTTYHFDTVNQQDALAYLQGPKKFTGWTDLITDTLNGKQFQ